MYFLCNYTVYYFYNYSINYYCDSMHAENHAVQQTDVCIIINSKGS